MKKILILLSLLLSTLYAVEPESPTNGILKFLNGTSDYKDQLVTLIGIDAKFSATTTSCGMGTIKLTGKHAGGAEITNTGTGSVTISVPTNTSGKNNTKAKAWVDGVLSGVLKVATVKVKKIKKKVSSGDKISAVANVSVTVKKGAKVNLIAKLHGGKAPIKDSTGDTL
ncbi:MAG: hypothetical protein HRT89_04410, partial [Lentisphaeria bacterium]|nr:hypothetical protein [Lentisphaeria bacterium]